MEEPKQEGPRSFTRFIEQVADGSAHEELSKALHRLVGVMNLEARSQSKEVGGELALKIIFRADDTGTFAAAYEVKLKEPAPRRPGSIFFVTRGGNLSLENQRQTRLPLREVGGVDAPAREVANERAEAREV